MYTMVALRNRRNSNLFDKAGKHAGHFINSPSGVYVTQKEKVVQGLSRGVRCWLSE